MSKKITFHIDQKGNITVKDVCGFGTGCQAATEDIEKLLGKSIEGSRELTENYHIPIIDLDIKQDNQ
jgi:hypothetical protein